MVDVESFSVYLYGMARPPKEPEDRRTEALNIPLTKAEKELIKSAAEKHVTWARETLVKAAKRKAKTT